MREIVGIGGDNESGPRTGKRKRAGNGESVLQPGPQGRVGRRQCKAEWPEGRQNESPLPLVAGWRPDEGARSSRLL